MAPKPFTLVLSEEELAELIGLVEQSVVETHAERRRTEAPVYHERVAHREDVLRGLLAKVRALGQ